jgi:NAD(P)-dependent dehydrogenase (short-subunit alcohol dehydrogenase family)
MSVDDVCVCITQHLAYEYARRGAYLALVARREESLREVGDAALAAGSPGVLVVAGDVSSPDDCRKFVDDTIRYFGRCKRSTLVIICC